MKNTILFSGTSNLPLAKKIAKIKNLKLGKIEISKFADLEIYVNIKENIKNKTVYIIQSCSTPANENFMELLIMLDAIQRLQPKQVIVVLPFYPYRRQEKQTKKGEPITASLVAYLLEKMGVRKVITLDLHEPKTINYFKIPVEHKTALMIFAQYFKDKKIKDLVVVAPDQGAIAQNKCLAKTLDSEFAYFKKSRKGKHDAISTMKLSGKVKNKNVILLDDEISTGGTLEKNVQFLKSQGAKDIYIAVTHAVLAGPAMSRIKKMKIKELLLTDSISLPKEKIIKKIKILSIANTLARTIK